MRSANHFILGQQELYETERAIVRFLGRWAPNASTGKMDLQLNKTIKELKVLMKNPLERKLLAFFDIVSWLESKSEKRTFSVVLEDKRQARLSAGNS